MTPDEAHLLRPSASDLLVFTPPLAARPVTRLKVEGQIKGLFMSRPSALPEGASNSKPLRPYTEPAVAIWVGEKKGAPATVALYTLASLIGKPSGDADKTENRNLPMTLARKAFYKADKLNVKWNNAGNMVGTVSDSANSRHSSSRTPMSTTLASRTTARPTFTSSAWTVPSRALLILVRKSENCADRRQGGTYLRLWLEPHISRVHCVLRLHACAHADL